jgi:hypothetical protein
MVIAFLFMAAMATATFFRNITSTITAESNAAAETLFSFSVDVCKISRSNAFLSYMEAAKMEVDPATTTVVDEGSITSTIPPSSFFTGTFSYKAQPPCCGCCKIFGGDVQVFY